MTYSRLCWPAHLPPKYFKGTSVRKYEWVTKPEEATTLPTEDANNVKRYFNEVAGYDLRLEPVLPSELPKENAIKS